MGGEHATLGEQAAIARAAADIAAARGYGGQDCFVLEDLDMVVTVTGEINAPVEMAEDVVTLLNTFPLPAPPGLSMQFSAEENPLPRMQRPGRESRCVA